MKHILKEKAMQDLHLSYNRKHRRQLRWFIVLATITGCALGIVFGSLFATKINKAVTDQKTRIIQEMLSKTIEIEVAPDGSSLTIITPSGLSHPSLNHDLNFHGWNVREGMDEKENFIVTFIPPTIEPYTPPQE